MSKKTSNREKRSIGSLNSSNESSKSKGSKDGLVDNSARGQKLAQLQKTADNSPQVQQAAQLQAVADQHSATTQLQEKKNNTGLPDNVKSGVEKLSGQSMDDVKVHYNSKKPAQLNAHAYAQGNNIHIASGQKKHVAHEAWHVAQQKQGRVKANTSSNGTPVNDSPKLEREADSMGAKAKSVGRKESK